MPGIVAGALVPHPPILVPEVGGPTSGRLQATADAMHRLDDALSRVDADLLVIISPHSPASLTALPVRRGPRAAGDLGRFRAPGVRIESEVEVACAARLVDEGRTAGFALTWAEESDLDHGVVVPLHFLPATTRGKPCLFLGISGWPLEAFCRFGAWLHAQLQDRSATLIASGDLSHRLTPDAPYGFRPEGRVFDGLVIDALREHHWDQIEHVDPELVEVAGECGLRPLAVMLGAARAAGLRSEVLSYEGPFGVGYPVVHFNAAARLDVEALGLAAIHAYVQDHRVIEPPDPIPAALQGPAAVFVTLRKHGELRGCVGSVRPTEPTAAHEIVRYAIAAAVQDPRFDPVRLEEISALTVKVQLIDPPEPILDPVQLDPSVYGLIVRSGARHALLLPGIETIDTPEQQIAAACEKAGIDRRAPLLLERFRTRMLA